MKRNLISFLVIAVVLAFLISGGIVFASPQKEETPAGFKIGFPAPATSDPTTLAMIHSLSYMAEVAGGELITDPWDFTPEGLVSTAERLLTKGADGLLIIPFADAILPRITQMAEEADASWSILFRRILDPEIKKLVEASPSYVGNTAEDEEEAGYQVMKRLAEQGVRNVALLAIVKGDTTGDARERGLRKAAKEYGVTILAEGRSFSQGSDATKAVESFIASYPELDGVYILGGGITPGMLQGVIQALQSHGKAGEVKVGMIDFAEGMDEAFEAGHLHVVCGGHLIVDPMFSMAMLLNEIMGKPLSDKPYTITLNFMYLENVKDMADYFTYVEGDIPAYNEEEIKAHMLKYFNPKVTVESLQALASAYSLEDVRSRR